MTNDKAYIVTSGQYSDYSINRVFRTKEEAERWIAKRWEPGDYSIEEWEFDKFNPSGLSGHCVFIDLETGDVTGGFDECDHEGPATYHAYFQPPSPYSWGRQTPLFRLAVRCLARDREHAIKIASECRRIVLTHPLYDVWRNSPDPSAYEMRSSADERLGDVLHSGL